MVDLRAYEHALNQGFGERDAVRAGEDAYEESQARHAEYGASAKAEYDAYCAEQAAEHHDGMLAEASK
jgi:hypothetical protein